MKNTKVALFDFCWTVVPLSTADGFVHFVRENTRSIQMRFKNLLRKILKRIGIIKFLEKHTQASIHKKIVLWQLKGLSQEMIEHWARLFYEKEIKKRLRLEILEEIEKLRADGYQLYVVSGGYDTYLQYFVREFNFDGLMCTKIQFKKAKATGMFEGQDCIGSNKIKFLNDYFHKESLQDIESIAYSDDISDIPLLKYCKKGVVVSWGRAADWAIVNKLENLVCRR